MSSLKTKTLNKLEIIGTALIVDETELSKSRTGEVQELLSHMIYLARKRGRPIKGGDYE